MTEKKQISAKTMGILQIKIILKSHEIQIKEEMQKLILILWVALTMTACFESTYKVEDLYGKWESESISFVFNEDGSCEYYMNGNKYPGETRFRPVTIGNALEITANGKVIMANLTINSLKDDQLTIETRQMIGNREASTQTHVLNRVD